MNTADSKGIGENGPLQTQGSGPAVPQENSPIMPHPDNPKYFLFRGRPTVLVTSASHYGAIINPDYDFIRELDELKRHGLNLVRLLGGHYREIKEDFGISRDILYTERYLAPFLCDGSGRYDPTRPNPAYHERLRAFAAACSERGIVVEYSLFCPFYHETLWEICPLNPANHGALVAPTDRMRFHTLHDPAMTALLEGYAAHILETLQPFDNVYFEIMNEPYVTETPLDFERYFAAFIRRWESTRPNRHMVSRNVANGWERLEHDPLFDLYSFHYASPPTAVTVNRGIPTAIGFNETGFAGNDVNAYRRQAWDFLMAGGSLFNNLDYSFAVGYEDGTWQHPSDPGAGSIRLRAQLGMLRRFLEQADLVRLQPDLAPLVRCHTLHGTGACLRGENECLFHFRTENELKVLFDLKPGTWRFSWLDCITGDAWEETVQSEGRVRKDFAWKNAVRELALHAVFMG